MRDGYVKEPAVATRADFNPRSMEPAALERLKLELGVPDSSDESGADKVCVTTPDRKFSLRTVACFGQCALAPVVEVDHAIFGHMNEQILHRELEHLNGRKV